MENRSIGRSAVSRSAFGTAAGRAIESCRRGEDRLFEDTFAMGFLPLTHRAIVHLLQVPWIGPALLSIRDRQIPGILGNLLCRTRFIDDTFREALANGFHQVVILGAGFDSRAYRIRGAGNIHVFEIDHPATQAWKRERIARLLGQLPSHVTFVPIDFERQQFGETLMTSGFRRDAATFFLWEGVTQYIGAKAVDAIFQTIAHSAPPGSRVLFTYIHGGIIDGTLKMRGLQKLLSELRRQGEVWQFGIHPVELAEYLAARRLKLIEEVGAADYRKRYLEPMSRRMRIFEGERIVVAEITGYSLREQ